MDKLGPYQFQMATAAVKLAKQRSTINEYRQFCHLQPRGRTQSFNDRIRILEFLLGERIILRDGDTLQLGSIENASWLIDDLKKGGKDAWHLADALNLEDSKLNKFDEEQNKEIGLRGELFVLDKYKQKLPDEFLASLQHLSITRDDLGYDILSPSPLLLDKKLLLEVKTTCRPTGDFCLYLSSNEYKVSQKSKSWYIVLVRIIDNKEYIVGHLPGRKLTGLMPTNLDDRVKWNSVKIKVAPEWITPSLPN